MLQLSSSPSKTRDILPQLLYVSSAQLQFVSSAAIRWLTCSLSAQVHIVTSAANCQLSCTLLVQIILSYQLNMLLELSAFSSFVRLHSVSSTVFHQLDIAL
ncbi:TPA: hypothetical protein ACH3X3_002221 [Trebouxia sp. C0006]